MIEFQYSENSMTTSHRYIPCLELTWWDLPFADVLPERIDCRFGTHCAPISLWVLPPCGPCRPTGKSSPFGSACRNPLHPGGDAAPREALSSGTPPPRFYPVGEYRRQLRYLAKLRQSGPNYRGHGGNRCPSAGACRGYGFLQIQARLKRKGPL